MLFKTLTANKIDLNAPSLDIDVGTDLLLENGGTIYFQVSAFNIAEESISRPDLRYDLSVIGEGSSLKMWAL